MRRGSPYPLELRQRVIALCERGDMTWEQVADLLGVGVATVNRWNRRKKATGSPAALPHGGGQVSRLTEAELVKLRELVVGTPDQTIPEFVEAIAEVTGKRLSTSTIGRAIRKLGFTRKKRLWSPASRAALRSSPRGKPSSRRFAESRRAGSSSSTRPARTSR